jgi:hypothetical protein
MAGSKFASLRGILLLAKNHLSGALPQMLNNSYINKKFEQYMKTGIRGSAGTSQKDGGMAMAMSPGQLKKDRRDPLMVGFEKYLLSKLTQADVRKDKWGVYLFNVNRVAYLVEKSEDDSKQRTTRNRVNKGVHAIKTITRKCTRSGKGEV